MSYKERVETIASSVQNDWVVRIQINIYIITLFIITVDYWAIRFYSFNLNRFVCSKIHLLVPKCCWTGFKNASPPLFRPPQVIRVIVCNLYSVYRHTFIKTFLFFVIIQIIQCIIVIFKNTNSSVSRNLCNSRGDLLIDRLYCSFLYLQQY